MYFIFTDPRSNFSNAVSQQNEERTNIVQVTCTKYYHSLSSLWVQINWLGTLLLNDFLYR